MATLQSVVRCGEQVLFRELEGEAILLSLTTGEYFGLDEVGARMWALLTASGPIDRAYRALLEEYDVSADRLQKDLLDIVDELLSQGLLQLDQA